MKFRVCIVFLLCINLTLAVRGQLIDDRRNNSVFQHALNQYISTVGDSYKIDGYGVIVVEIESMSFGRDDESWFQNISDLNLIFYPFYQSAGLIERPPNTIFLHNGHLFCLYSGVEKLIEGTFKKKELKAYKSFFSDLNGRTFSAGAEMIRIRLNSIEESVFIERDIKNWQPTLLW